LIVDREGEVKAFVPEEYWSIEVALAWRSPAGEESTFKAKLRAVNGQKGRLKIGTGDEARRITADLDSASYKVAKVTKKEQRRRPAAPFITSTLQQEANRKLGFTARRTMTIAQQLYEGIALGGQESAGLITYMRTDSTNVAAGALAEIGRYVKDKYGPNYAPKTPRKYAKKVKGAQEAHEAIRPTSILQEPGAVREYLSREQARLYDLIWRRMLASQMTDAIFDSTSIDVAAASAGSNTVYEFRATGSVLRFPGFRRLYLESKDDAAAGDDDDVPQLPDLSEGDPLDERSLTPEQHFTQPPPRFTEATLVKALEEQGIGRPSTYAPTLATVMDRDYVRKDKGRFVPTKLGTAVSNLLTTHFPEIMDLGFTARVEEQLDEIASGERSWKPVLKEFYGPFNEAVKKALAEAERVPRDQIDEETDEVCEVCGRPMVIKTGRFGRFLSCSGFPECKTSRPLLERVGVECPECGNDLVERQSKAKGRRGGRSKFYGCSNYPACTFAVNQRPLPQPCPECSKMLVASGRSNAKCTSCDFRGPIPEDEVVELAS
jgi:DNA topoisomerase-1